MIMIERATKQNRAKTRVKIWIDGGSDGEPVYRKNSPEKKKGWREINKKGCVIQLRNVRETYRILDDGTPYLAYVTGVIMVGCGVDGSILIWDEQDIEGVRTDGDRNKKTKRGKK